MEEAIYSLILDQTARKAKTDNGPAVMTREEIDRAVTAAINNLSFQQKIKIGISKGGTWIRPTTNGERKTEPENQQQ